MYQSMKPKIGRQVRPLKRCLLDRKSTTAVEFAIVGPVFLLFLFAIIGVGLDGFYQFLLDDSLRLATRQLQIDGPAEASAGNFVAEICSEFGILSNGCTTNLSYNVQGDTLAAGFTALTPVALPLSGVLPDGFFSNPNGAGYANYDNYLVQVAYPLPFKMPFVSRLITYTNSGSILATTITRGEPFN